MEPAIYCLWVELTRSQLELGTAFVCFPPVHAAKVEGRLRVVNGRARAEEEGDGSVKRLGSRWDQGIYRILRIYLALNRNWRYDTRQ
jgi:hypothetical protein